MFLSGDILSRNGKSLIEPFEETRVDCAAYSLRMGSEAYVSPDGQRDARPKLRQLAHEEAVEIPAGQFAFLLTHESVTIPYHMIAFINMKNGLKSSGLVNVSGFHVDPGYSGKLVFAVFNAGPKRITLRRGDGAFLIWFARLEGATTEFSRKKSGFTKIDSELIARVPEESASLNSLDLKIEELSKQVSWLRTALVAGGGIAASLLTALLVS